MEIMMVLVILVIIGALAIPCVTTMLQGNNLDAAEYTVTTELTKARNKAKEERRPYKFAVKVNTGEYRFAPDDDGFWGGSGNAGSSSDASCGTLESTVTTGSLPEKVCFSQPDGISNNSGNADWSTFATFLADGTAVDDVSLSLTLEGFSAKVIRLKAATGTISTAQPAGADAR